MQVKNFPGFVAVRNYASHKVEFQWNSVIYEMEPNELANMPVELAYGAMKNTVYHIDDDGGTHSYILPEGYGPTEPIPPKTGNTVKDYLWTLPDADQYKTLTVPGHDHIKHSSVGKDFRVVPGAKSDA